MKKFYCFKEGQKLPSWMWGVETHKRESVHKNKAGSATFGVSCIAVRETGCHTKLMPARVGDDVAQIKVEGFENATMGGVNGATGVCLFDDNYQSLHGYGLTYKITNSKVKNA